MRKFLSILIASCAFMLSAFAQETTISGRVLDDRGNPLQGISVVVQGTNRGVSTGADGNFTITANRNNTIVLSGVNFETLSMRGSGNFNTVVLKGKVNPLEEVIVTGYQTRKKRDEAGAVSTVRAAQI